MLKIRLARVGKKKQPTYRFVVSDSQKDLYGKQLEILGHYNPFSKVCEVQKDRILYWISKGAQPSPTAHNLLVDQNVIAAAKVKAVSISKKKKAKAEEAAKSAATAKAAATPAIAEEKPAEAAAAEVPAEPAEEVKPDAPAAV